MICLESEEMDGYIMIIAILGIGEAGGTLARDLIAAGVQVRGWDPEPRMIPDGLDFASSNPAAASGADIVLSVNWASVAVEVATEVAPVLQPGSTLCGSEYSRASTQT